MALDLYASNHYYAKGKKGCHSFSSYTCRDIISGITCCVNLSIIWLFFLRIQYKIIEISLRLRTIQQAIKQFELQILFKVALPAPILCLIQKLRTLFTRYVLATGIIIKCILKKSKIEYDGFPDVAIELMPW